MSSISDTFIGEEAETLVSPSGGRDTEILCGRGYYWKEWCLAKGRDCLYIWSDAAALELSNGSNGWFRYVCLPLIMYNFRKPTNTKVCHNILDSGQAVLRQFFEN